MNENVIKAALLGFGTVGTGVYKVLKNQEKEMSAKIGGKVEIKKILVRNIEKAAAKIEDASLFTSQWDEIINDPEIEIVIELMGGINPAKEYILSALKAGKHVVSANKDLIAVHDRARGDLKIESIEADGLIVTIHTEQPVPALLNYLSDPYGCIIDMQAGVTDDGNVAGTGPYRAVQVETDQGLTLVKNDNYWNGTPKLDRIEVKAIRDGDTMTMALQSGELDAAYGLPYSNLILFRDEPYTISSADTSRTFFGQFNGSSEVLQDDRVREAVIGAIDREGFVNTLMEGNGSVAEGPFPSYFAFGDSKVQEESYDLEYSRELLAEAGWTDEDGDGYVEKDGKRLTICWLTYPSRQELPLLAESAQASLKKIGIEVQIQCTANHLELLKKGNWDVYVSAFVSAPTGDPEYFFTTHCLQDSSKNRGGYYSETLEMLEQQLSGEFDTEKRTELAIEMTQTLLDDHMFFFASHLKMSMVSGGGVTGLTAHPCDYYEITVNLDKNK